MHYIAVMLLSNLYLCCLFSVSSDSNIILETEILSSWTRDHFLLLAAHKIRTVPVVHQSDVTSWRLTWEPHPQIPPGPFPNPCPLTNHLQEITCDNLSHLSLGACLQPLALPQPPPCSYPAGITEPPKVLPQIWRFQLNVTEDLAEGISCV